MIYKTQGVCCREMAIDVQDGIIQKIEFSNGCDGNLKGIARLAVGRKAADIIPMLTGIKCGPKSTSCPDQLAAALRTLEL